MMCTLQQLQLHIALKFKTHMLQCDSSTYFESELLYLVVST